MAVTFQRITVSTTPVALNSAGTAGVTLYVRNESANAVDVGGSTVAVGTGMSLAANTYLPFAVELAAGDQLWAIRSGGSDGTLFVIRMS